MYEEKAIALPIQHLLFSGFGIGDRSYWGDSFVRNAHFLQD
jgi:hypothetical protein